MPAIPATTAALARVSLIAEGPEKRVRMANLAIVGTHSTNGVAEIHSRLLRTTVVSDLAEIFPERFNNKTNGVTPRRWLLLANPDLARLITERDRRRLGHRPDPAQEDRPPGRRPVFLDGFRQAKRAAKARFAVWLRMTHGLAVDPDSIFDSQVKRIHEYKRQLLNILHVIILVQPPARQPQAGRAAAHLLLRGQGGAGLHPGQADHQADQQRGVAWSTSIRRPAASSRSSS